MTNQYHIIHKIPIYKTKFGMEKEYEELANQLASSGKIRISDTLKCNFVRFSDNFSRTFFMISDLELSDPALLNITKEKLKPFLGANLEKEITKLKKNLEKHYPVSYEMLLQIARLFVQSCHPIVTRWLIFEKVEIFISFSHNIEDMMDMQNWKENGQNSGMQSTNGKDAAIFVSCGGDPLAETNEEHPEYGDGLPAIARMIAIAGQETGHYADIMRDDKGRQISRHSADFAATKARPHVKAARLEDIKRCEKFLEELNESGLSNLTAYDSILKSLKENKVTGLSKIKYKILSILPRLMIRAKAKEQGWFFVSRILQEEEFPGLILRAIYFDMKFNLEPKASVYIGANKEETEAIACVEALARVPQQVNKWGHLATEYFMHDLYYIYYAQVIPSLIEKYEKVTGTIYKRDKSIIESSFFSKITSYFKNKKEEEKITELIKKSRSILN